jgi:GntR family transcriptional regulator
MSELDTNSYLLLYKQLADKIRDGICNGTFKYNERIPGEFELSEQYKVSRSTVRKAIISLVDEGLLIKIHGKGTFVATPKLRQPSTGFRSFTEEMLAMGKKLVTKVIHCTMQRADDDDVQFLGVMPQSDVVVLKRLRYVDNVPICIETTHLSADHRYLLNEDLNTSLYKVLREKHDIHPAAGTKTFEICYALPEEAELLDIPRGSALMLVEDRVFDSKGKPLYITKQVMCGDKFKYAIVQ